MKVACKLVHCTCVYLPRGCSFYFPKASEGLDLRLLVDSVCQEICPFGEARSATTHQAWGVEAWSVVNLVLKTDETLCVLNLVCCCPVLPGRLFSEVRHDWTCQHPETAADGEENLSLSDTAVGLTGDCGDLQVESLLRRMDLGCFCLLAQSPEVPRVQSAAACIRSCTRSSLV